jgi:hypothetical protein
VIKLINPGPEGVKETLDTLDQAIVIEEEI